MADALSAVATNASPRAVAKASWLASPKPFAEAFKAKTPEIIIASSLNVLRRFIISDSQIQTTEQTP
jgi:hypothetical protein